MLGGAGLDLPIPGWMRNCITLRGQWMYPPHAALLMAGLIRRAMSISINSRVHFVCPSMTPTRRLAQSARDSGPFRMTVIEPPRLR